MELNEVEERTYGKRIQFYTFRKLGQSNRNCFFQVDF